MLEQIKKTIPRKIAKNGALLLGDVQSLYKDEKKQYNVIGTYVHVLYPPIKCKDEVLQLKTEVPFLSADYLSFLQKYNGLNAYSDSFCLYGFGRILVEGKYMISRDPDIVLPYHLGDYNKKKNELYEIGTFCECKLLNDSKKEFYYLLNRKNEIVAKWDSINNLITDCISELSSYYDENGKAKNPTIMGKILFNKITKK